MSDRDIIPYTRSHRLNDHHLQLIVIGHTLIRQLPVPLLPLSFTPNLITVILSTINYPSLN